jgi:hypothetical protein
MVGLQKEVRGLDTLGQAEELLPQRQGPLVLPTEVIPVEGAHEGPAQKCRLNSHESRYRDFHKAGGRQPPS